MSMDIQFAFPLTPAVANAHATHMAHTQSVFRRLSTWQSLALALVFGVVALFHGINGEGEGRPWPVVLGLGLWLLVLSWFDFDHFRLPDLLTLPLIPAGLWVSRFGDAPNFLECILGAVIGYGLFFGIGEVWRRWRGVHALGLGDAKLLAGIGAWTGILALPYVLMIASVSGLLFVVAQRVDATAPSEASTGIAFGPHLALAFWLVWLVAANYV